MKLRLLWEHILVRVRPPEKTYGLIDLPDTLVGSGLRVADVVQVGPGAPLGDGTYRAMEVEVGDVVIYHNWNTTHKQGLAIGHILEELGPGYALIQERDVMLVCPPGSNPDVR